MIETGTLWVEREGIRANYSLELVSLLKATEREIGEWIDDHKDLNLCGWTSLEKSSEVLDILAKNNFVLLERREMSLGNCTVLIRHSTSQRDMSVYLWTFKDCRCKYCDEIGTSLVEMIEDPMTRKAAFACEHHFHVLLLEIAFRRGASKETEIFFL